MSVILLVEDEVTLTLLVTMTLEDEGYTVVTASNGAKGVEMVRRHAPALVVTDYMMPVMDGVEMIRVLRADGFDGPILLTSAVGEDAIPGRDDLAYEAFLPKPYHENRLLGLIAAHLDPDEPSGQAAREAPPA